jgi:ParB/RepB/Spo0J family partition protein
MVITHQEPKIRLLPLKDIVPMQECVRLFFNPVNYADLKKSIEEDGYDQAYPIRVIWNKELGKFECFDGSHRLKAVTEIGAAHNIPAIDETNFFTRVQCISKGIKANKNRASLNPIDFAVGLKALAQNFAASKKKRGFGRPKETYVNDVAEIMHMKNSTVSKLLKLLKLPKDVQKLIGERKLWLNNAVQLTRLLGTPHEKEISRLANDIVEKSYTVQKTVSVVEAILKHGFYSDDCECPNCKRVFPSDLFQKLKVCLDCAKKLRLGRLDEDIVEGTKEARREYLKLNAFAERHYGKQIPACLNEKLDELYYEWLGKQRIQD